MDEFILSVSGAHQAHSAYAENNTRGLVRRPVFFRVRDYKHRIIDRQIKVGTLEWEKIILFDIFAALFDPSIYHINNFASLIPGFTDFEQDDKLLCIKLGVFEVWLVHASRLINTLDCTVTFSDGSFLSRQQMELLFGNDFAMMLFNFAVWFNSLRLNDSEIALYSAAVLFSAGRCGIKDKKSIQQKQQQLLMALKYQLNKSHSRTPLMFVAIVTKLPWIHMLGEKYIEQLGWFRDRCTHLKLPELFAEIFNFPVAKVDIEIQSRM